MFVDVCWVEEFKGFRVWGFRDFAREREREGFGFKDLGFNFGIAGRGFSSHDAEFVGGGGGVGSVCHPSLEFQEGNLCGSRILRRIQAWRRSCMGCRGRKQ